MEIMSSFGERWNAPAHTALPHWIEHAIFHLMKIVQPVHKQTLILYNIKH